MENTTHGPDPIHARSSGAPVVTGIACPANSAASPDAVPSPVTAATRRGDPDDATQARMVCASSVTEGRRTSTRPAPSPSATHSPTSVFPVPQAITTVPRDPPSRRAGTAAATAARWWGRGVGGARIPTHVPGGPGARNRRAVESGFVLYTSAQGYGRVVLRRAVPHGSVWRPPGGRFDPGYPSRPRCRGPSRPAHVGQGALDTRSSTASPCRAPCCVP